MHSPRGFTLIEILAATTIFAMLVAVVYAALFGATRLREAAYQASSDSIPRAHLASIIRRDLANACVPAGVLQGALLGTSETNNKSDADTLEFFSTSGAVTDSAPWGEVQKVEYYLDAPAEDELADGSVLVRKVTRNLLATTVDENDTRGESRLLQGVSGLTFSYYDADASAWVESWDSTALENKNPAGVKVRIDFENANPAERARLPLEITVPIKAQPRPAPAPTTVATGGGGAT